MRKHIKKDILNILQSLNRASSKVESVVRMGDIETLQDFLTECQNAAITVGTQIDEYEGEGTEAVTHLEEYCELLYQVLIGNAASIAKLEPTINQVIAQVEKMPERLEAVFLPYKASMWDSLESVWMDARDDENCDAYVIPIPYFDKNPDGSFREEHYEGDLYPEYVPITRYDEYDFGKRKPDIIFIHNPYDEWNHVTSVHPFFYAKNLKQFTDKLVYIPYFVLAEIDPENEEAVKQIEHFCTVPGVVYSDKVIVQSEDMRRIYINAMKKWMDDETVGENYWEEKILGLGSPKMDKVSSTNREGVELPEAWKRVMCKPDGSLKKIVFYNTTVNGILKNDEKMLDKIENTLKIFKENQDEVVLLWRPHPLIKATLESMRPELLERYNQIVEMYRQEGWGIYDDTADLNRAIEISDAYYGDGSSVVELFKAKQKPVLFVNVDIL